MSIRKQRLRKFQTLSSFLFGAVCCFYTTDVSCLLEWRKRWAAIWWPISLILQMLVGIVYYFIMKETFRTLDRYFHFVADLHTSKSFELQLLRFPFAFGLSRWQCRWSRNECTSG